MRRGSQMATIDLNSDVGESFGRWSLGDDLAMFNSVSSANVACGFHTGHPSVIRRTCREAAAAGVVIGAHVGYRDRAGFGRRFMDISPTELADDVVYQIGALQALAAVEGARLQSVKPHGGLYNAIVTHTALISAALSRVCPDVLYALFTVFVAVYATKELGMTTGDVLAAILIGSAFQLFLIPAAGALTDRFNRRMVYGIAAAASAAWIPVFFLIIQGRSEVMLIIGVMVSPALHAFMYGPQAAYITEQFPARLRYAGSSLAYTLAGVIGGAVAPLIFTALYAASGNWYLIAGYLLLASIVTIVGLAIGRNPQPEADPRLLHNDGAQESHA